ncbi:fungal zn(2)-Cys(6) binuclear cluster domain-containing protein [Pochonia chlamydosporia 170]|uniref:Fungal zn(2)-Cys(6) binuclear cluster domain-containing protein n=1 Tax=Pochonia chlamydosporia 170 TaxID=1380566 RepID=A0A219APM0_METCM|nr:fungal zn(2)-Cys(6) binuclear cluster domain-containing protein [Pochonia chlamydosporia 170]OWT42651.1 fungal zn(2)-Cys(6) binuclear cluster domain-containing protein [Pochonia chlamydosporia 170]
MRDRRKPTHNACVLCRAKRIKCDGGRPCSMCVGRDIDCQYIERQWEPKRNLVLEAQRLRSQVQRRDRVLSELANTSRALQVVQWLHDGRSIDDIYQYLVTYVDTAKATKQQTNCQFYNMSSSGWQNQNPTENGPWHAVARLSQDQTIGSKADLRSSVSDNIPASDAAIRPSEPTSVFPLNTGEHISPLHAEEISCQ